MNRKYLYGGIYRVVSFQVATTLSRAIKAAMNNLGYCGSALDIEAVGERRCVNQELSDRYLASRYWDTICTCGFGGRYLQPAQDL